jgi:outer membrane protein, heavy metal efflux system
MFCRRTAVRLACATAILIGGPLMQSVHAQTLTMRAALSRALAASPRLTAAERDVGIATGQRIQAGALLNPELSYEQDNSFGSGIYRGTRSAETTLQISQAFELFGKREARIAAGEAGIEVATIQRKAIRLELLSETAIAFLSVLGAQRRIQILDEQVAAIDRLTPLLRRRVEAGASSPAETGRARLRAGQGRSRALQGDACQRTARAGRVDG